MQIKLKHARGLDAFELSHQSIVDQIYVERDEEIIGDDYLLDDDYGKNVLPDLGPAIEFKIVCRRKIRKFQCLEPKLLIFRQNSSPKFLFVSPEFLFFARISIFRQNFYFSPKFLFFVKILIFRQNFDFWSTFLFFAENFYFSLKIRFFAENSIFGQNLDYWSKF